MMLTLTGIPATYNIPPEYCTRYLYQAHAASALHHTHTHIRRQTHTHTRLCNILQSGNMPSSWPQPAVLENLLNADNLGTKNGGKTATTPTDGDDAPSSPLYDHRVLALYKFVSPKIPKESLPALKAELETICRQHLARGTFLIAEEGINGTICYPFRHKAAAATAISTATTAVVDEDSLATVTQESIVERKEDGDELLSLLQAKFDGSLRIRISPADRPVFARLKIKIKSEIVTMHWQGDKQNSKNSARSSASRGSHDPDACHDRHAAHGGWSPLQATMGYIRVAAEPQLSHKSYRAA